MLMRACLCASIAVLAVPVALLAHAHLERSEPSSRDRLTAPPTAIRLWFSERPELGFTRVRLLAADSSEIALGAVARMTGEPMGVSLPIPTTLPAGTYTVLWRTAAADGHATTGSYRFDVVAAPATAARVVDTTPNTSRSNALVHADSTAESLTSLNASAATRWLEFMAMLAVIGGVAFQLVVLPRAQTAMAGALSMETRYELSDSARRLAQSALILLLVTAASRFYSEARAVLGPERAMDRVALRMVLGTSWGTGWLIGVIGVLVTALGILVVRRLRADAGWLVAALGALGIGVAPALTGHASVTRPVGLSIVLDAAHVLAACAWVGTLLTLLFTAVPLVRGGPSREGIGSGPLVASLVRAFHPIALTCAAIVIASGLLSAWLRLPTVTSLWTSSYGKVLLLKLALVAVVVILGARNWRRVMPTLGDDASARRITRTAGAELTMAALVLAVTAVLVSTSPPDRALAPVAQSATR
jgi:copper transport protein